MPLSQNINSYTLYAHGLSGSRGTTNNTSKVIAVYPPQSTDYITQIASGEFSIKNLDTASNRFTTYISGSDGEKIIDQIILYPGEKWTTDANIIINETTSFFCIKLSSSVQVNQFAYNVVSNEIIKG